MDSGKTTSQNLLLKTLLTEAAGTFVLVFIGTCTLAVAVFTSVDMDIWHVAGFWGFGVTLAIYLSAGVSGAHLNPAVTLAFALRRPQQFPLMNVLTYWIGQVTGALLAGVGVWVIFRNLIHDFEVENALIRGMAGSERSAMVFGQYFPNPSLHSHWEDVAPLVTPWMAATIEAVGTAVLVFVIFALADRRGSLKMKILEPMVIGATVAVLIGVFGPLTQGGWNPARDFGPRIVSFVAGWGEIAIPGPASGFWAYIVGPMLGGIVGSFVYDVFIKRILTGESSTGLRNPD